MSILSIQSWVSYGHVGNAAALFPLQRLGAEVLTINTVQYSNHPGHGGFAGRTTGGEAVADLLDGLLTRGMLDDVDTLISGYLGDAATARAMLDGLSRLRELRPNLLYCCDPVLGDEGTGLYVPPSLATLLREQAVGRADILTPNLFELGYLVNDATSPDGPTRDLAALVRDARILRDRMRGAGPGLVLVTSARTRETPPDCVDLLLVAGADAWTIRTPRLSLHINGAGDLIAALFTLHVGRHRPPAEAFERATSAVWCILSRTADQGAREPLIVQAQDQLVTPFRSFEAVRIDGDAGAA